MRERLESRVVGAAVTLWTYFGPQAVRKLPVLEAGRWQPVGSCGEGEAVTGPDRFLLSLSE